MAHFLERELEFFEHHAVRGGLVTKMNFWIPSIAHIKANLPREYAPKSPQNGDESVYIKQLQKMIKHMKIRWFLAGGDGGVPQYTMVVRKVNTRTYGDNYRFYRIKQWEFDTLPTVMDIVCELYPAWKRDQEEKARREVLEAGWNE